MKITRIRAIVHWEVNLLSVCAFFGHRDCPETVKPALRDAIERLITDYGVDTFYVGNQGQFDACVRGILRQMQKMYPHIRYAVVLAYLPVRKDEYEDYSDTVYPEGMEDGPPKFAIARRNQWLVNQADHIICYVRHSWGGAYQFSRLAKRQGKHVINICNTGIEL